MGTKQPAIARIEAGSANVQLRTILLIAEGLDATVRIDLDPAELLSCEAVYPKWWNRETAVCHLTSPVPVSIQLPSLPQTVKARVEGTSYPVFGREKRHEINHLPALQRIAQAIQHSAIEEGA